MKIITENKDFEDFCIAANQQRVVGIDTEFVWTNTYYAKLGLVQIAWDRDNFALVDPLAVTGKATFTALLENPNVTKVFHEASSDLPILRRWCGALPRNVVDTRIAAGFCGLTAGMSLAKLLVALLAVVLPKTETRTDWLQRPLSDAQLKYAGDDAALLPELYAKLYSMMDKCGNFQCFLEEMRVYGQEEFYAEQTPEDAWKRVSRSSCLKITQQDYAVLQRLAAWRESLAREMDVTKNRILKDEWLALAAVKHPHSVEDVIKLDGMWPKIAAKYGEQIVEIVANAMNMSKDQWPVMFIPDIDQRVLKQGSDRVLSLVKKKAEARSIDPVLVASRKEADSFVTTSIHRKDINESHLMKGWRYELLKPSIDEIARDLGRKKVVAKR